MWTDLYSFSIFTSFYWLVDAARYWVGLWTWKCTFIGCRRNHRRVARNFWGSGRFLQIRAQIHNSSERLNYMQTLQRPSFKNNYLFQIQIFLVDIQARSSNVNEVIRAVLNSLFFYYCFFLRLFFTKSTKTQPSKSTTGRTKSTKSTKSTMTQPSKITKRYKRTVRVWWSHYTNNSVSIHTNKN